MRPERQKSIVGHDGASEKFCMYAFRNEIGQTFENDRNLLLEAPQVHVEGQRGQRPSGDPDEVRLAEVWPALS